MNNLKVVLEKPAGNFKASLKSKFNVSVGILHKGTGGTAEIIYDPDYFLIDISKKIQNFGSQPYSRINWTILPIKLTSNGILIKIVVREDQLIQLCSFNLEVI